MMRMDVDKGPPDWMAFQQQQSTMPYNPHVMQKSPSGMMGQAAAVVGRGAQMELDGIIEEDVTGGRSKSSKKSKARRNSGSTASNSPTPPSSRSSTQHIQQQVLQQQMALPPLEPEVKKAPKRSKKKKVDPGLSPAEVNLLMVLY
jgi:hypothetical protein